MHPRVFFAQLTHAHCKKKFKWKEKLKEYDENPHLHILWEEIWSNIPCKHVLFYKLQSVHATNTCYNKRCGLHLGWVVVGSIIGFVGKRAHIEFHYIQISCISLNSLKI